MTAPSARRTHIGYHPLNKVRFIFTLHDFPYRNMTLTTYQDGQKIAYFRGRKLHGQSVKVPQGYRGIIVEKQEAVKPQTARHDEPETVDLDAEEDDVPLGALKKRSDFDDMIVWGHESNAEASSDPYVRGVDEWVALAEQVRPQRCFHRRTADDRCRYIRTKRTKEENEPSVG